MARRRKRRKWPVILGLFIIMCIFTGLGAAAYKLLPDLFASTKEVIETVKMKTSPLASVPFEEIKISEEDVAGGYYYQQLGEEEQSLYKEMYQGLKEASPTIYMHSPDMKVVAQVSQFISMDRPELFWCDG